MKTLSDTEAVQWIKAVGLEATLEKSSAPTPEAARCWRSIEFPGNGFHSFRLGFPKLPYQTFYVANALLPHRGNEGEIDPLLIWLTDYGFWSEIVERVGAVFMRALRESGGETKNLGETPAHLFEQNEVTLAQAFLSMPILMGWNAYMVQQTGEYYVFVSNDEFIEVVSRNEEAHRRLLERVRSLSPLEPLEQPPE